MANGRFRLGKQSGGTLGLVFPDGVSDTEVVLPESGELATKDYVDDLKTIASGTATFNSTTNNINLTGIGIGVEIGDVIQISGAEDAKNNREFTVEVITDDNNIIVNQAHANKGTSKNIANRVSDTDVTVKLLSKWYNAPDGLGQGWINVVSSRALSTSYPNVTNRTIGVSVGGLGTLYGNFLAADSINGRLAFAGIPVSNQYVGINFNVNTSYSVIISGGGLNGMHWYERR